MKNNTRKIILALILVFTMMMSFATVSVFAADDSASGSTVYLKPDSNWLTDSPRFAIYAWGTGLDAVWVNMAASTESGVYEGVVPAGYTNMIFCRMNPNVTENRWNTDADTDETKAVWNQTVDLTVTPNGTFTIENPWNSTSEGKATGSWNGSSSGTTTPDVGGNTGTTQGELAVGDYYLAGYIEGRDYGIEADSANLGSYKFINGKLSVSLSMAAYVVVKDAQNNIYWSPTYVDKATTAEFFKGDKADKLYVPGGQVNFTLYHGTNGSLVLSYEIEAGSEIETPTIDENDTIRVYASNTMGWDTVFYYCWVSGGSAYVEWPGLEMELDADGYWYADVPKACDNIIFNNGQGDVGNQTLDLKTPTGDKIVCDIKAAIKDGVNSNINAWYTKAECKPFIPTPKVDTDREVTLVLKNDANWANVYVYYWSSENVAGSIWPGVKVEASQDGLYYVVIPEGNYHVIFNNGEEGEALQQTADLVIPTDDNVLFNNSTHTWSEMRLEANHPSTDNNGGSGNSGNATEGMSFLQQIAKAFLLFLRSIEDFFKGLFGG